MMQEYSKEVFKYKIEYKFNYIYIYIYIKIMTYKLQKLK